MLRNLPNLFFSHKLPSELKIADDGVNRYLSLAISLTSFMIAIVVLTTVNLDSGFSFSDYKLKKLFLIQLPSDHGNNATKIKILKKSLKQSSSISKFHRLSKEQIIESASPWIKNPKTLEFIPLPIIFELEIKSGLEDEFDYDAFEAYLKKSSPDVTVGGKENWIENFSYFITFVKWLAFIVSAISLMGLLTIIIIIIKTSITINRENIDILILVGAEAGYIARQFSIGLFIRSFKSCFLGVVSAGVMFICAALFIDIGLVTGFSISILSTISSLAILQLVITVSSALAGHFVVGKYLATRLIC